MQVLIIKTRTLEVELREIDRLSLAGKNGGKNKDYVDVGSNGLKYILYES